MLYSLPFAWRLDRSRSYRIASIAWPFTLFYFDVVIRAIQSRARFLSHACFLWIAIQLTAQAAVSLRPSRPSPWQVGAVIVWTANPSSGTTGDFWYRFRAR